LQLAIWSVQTFAEVVDISFVQMLINSFGLSIATALVATVISIVLIYSSRINQNPLSNLLNKVAGVGYAIPGAVIAIGVLSLVFVLNKVLGENITLASSGVSLLIYAYTVRFLAVSMNPVDGGFEKISMKVDESATALGKNTFQILLKIHFPILRKTFLTALILTFVDTMKELPLTLILRPFNFDTLATKAFEYAGDEMVEKASSASLLIILISVPVIYMLHRASKR
jgi:iron(III) transport system permease protein